MSKVSILIPTYKRSDLLQEAINSCIDQTITPWEIIIGDDSPDDVTKNLVLQIKKQTQIPVNYIHNIPSLGQAENINKLFESATGDKIILLHDDDLLLQNSVETLLSCFIKHPEIDVAYGKQYLISQSGTIDYKTSEEFNDYYFRNRSTEGFKLDPVESGFLQQFPNDGYMLSSKVINELKFRTYCDIGFVGDACDYDFGFRVGLKGYKIYFTNVYTAKYRLTSGAISTSVNNYCAYFAYKLLKNTNLPAEFDKKKIKKLREFAPIAIAQAISSKVPRSHYEATKIYFSKYHKGKILSLGGIKRLLLIIVSFAKNRFTQKSVVNDDKRLKTKLKRVA